MILHAGAHVLTDRPDLTREMFARNLERCTIIEYPHAVSGFLQSMGLSSWYFAETLSHRRGDIPAFISVWGILDEKDPLLDQILKMAWAVKGKYVYECEIRCQNGVTVTEEYFEHKSAQKSKAAQEAFPILFPEVLSIAANEKKETPTMVAHRLSRELGIFIGGEELDGFLKRECVFKKQLEYSTIYKSDHRYDPEDRKSALLP